MLGAQPSTLLDETLQHEQTGHTARECRNISGLALGLSK